jgi:hypothetical protein
LTEEGFSLNYPKAIHITRVAHALHRIRGTIFVLYPDADKLVANGKEISVKSPARTEVFKNKSPNIPFTPNSSNYTLWNLVGGHSVLCIN